MNPLIYIIWTIANLLTICYILFPQKVASGISYLGSVASIIVLKRNKYFLKAKKKKRISLKNTLNHA